MVNYQNGKIYKIVDNTNGSVYIGSTCEINLSRRLQKHKARYKYWLKHGKGNKFSSSNIIMNDDFKIELIETYPCNNIEELLKKEQFWIDKIDCINKNRSIGVNVSRNKKMQYYSNKKRLDYVNSWGGDGRYNNNLWNIYPFIFNE
tara:strand:+ start:369 stop:806 length:438 start_codon:yes stop_codon:yes gene_type:complete